MTEQQAMRMALEALEQCMYPQQKQLQAITALRQAIEQQPADEPVAWKVDVDLQNFQGQSEYRTILAWNADPVWTGTHEINEVLKAVPLYTSPQPVAWLGLTDEEIEKGREQTFSINNPYCPCDSKTMRKAVRWAEAKLKEKNT